MAPRPLFCDGGGTMFATGSSAAYLKGYDNGYRFRDMVSGTRQRASPHTLRT